MTTYNKLVRDLIPRLIEANGEQCEVRVLSSEEYDVALKAKMQEELQEFLAAMEGREQLEELADLLEVIYSYAGSKGVEMEELERIRQRKREERGGFNEKLLLISAN